jgi:hypothetical protein
MENRMTEKPAADSTEATAAGLVRPRQKILYGLAGLIALLLIALFVWPTPYKSEPSLYFFQGYRKIRSDRSSGALQMKFDSGWADIKVQRLDKNLGLVKFGGNEFKIQFEDNGANWMDQVHIP